MYAFHSGEGNVGSYLNTVIILKRWYQWPRVLRPQVYGRSPTEIVGLNPTGAMDVCRECCMLSGRGHSDQLITRTEESYPL